MRVPGGQDHVVRPQTSHRSLCLLLTSSVPSRKEKVTVVTSTVAWIYFSKSAVWAFQRIPHSPQYWNTPQKNSSRILQLRRSSRTMESESIRSKPQVCMELVNDPVFLTWWRAFGPFWNRLLGINMLIIGTCIQDTHRYCRFDFRERLPEIRNSTATHPEGPGRLRLLLLIVTQGSLMVSLLNHC